MARLAGRLVSCPGLDVMPHHQRPDIAIPKPQSMKQVLMHFYCLAPLVWRKIGSALPSQRLMHSAQRFVAGRNTTYKIRGEQLVDSRRLRTGAVPMAPTTIVRGVANETGGAWRRPWSQSLEVTCRMA
jgi:hypothetical protein